MKKEKKPHFTLNIIHVIFIVKDKNMNGVMFVNNPLEILKSKYKFRQALKIAKDLSSNKGNLNYENIEEEMIKIMLDNDMIENQYIIYTLLENIKDEDFKTKMIDKYIKSKKLSLEEILKIPENLRIELLADNISYDELSLVLENFSDESIYSFLEKSKFMVDNIKNNELETFYADSYHIRDINKSETYILYQRLKKINDNNILQKINEIININDLSEMIDRYILKYNEHIDTYDFLINESNKIKVLDKIPLNEYNIIQYYKEFSEEGKQALRNKIFNIDFLNNYISKNDYNIERIDIYPLIKDYIEKDNIDNEVLKLIFLISKETKDINHLSESKDLIFNYFSDDIKSELLLDNKFFSNTASRPLEPLDKMLLLNRINDENIYMNTLIKYIENSKKPDNYNVENILSEYLATLSDDRKVKIVKWLYSNKEYKNEKLLISSIDNLQDSDNIVEGLKYYLNSKYKKNNLFINNKIMQLDNFEKLTNDIELDKFSKETILLILIRSDSEFGQKLLKLNPQIDSKVTSIYQKYHYKIKQLTRNYKNYDDLSKFYYQLLREDISKLDKKMVYLIAMQKNNENIVSTADLEIIEDKYFKAFGGIEGIEKILKYPETQKQMKGMSDNALNVMGIVYKFLENNIENPDYCLNEILNENFQFLYIESDVFRHINQYINSKDKLTLEDKNNIFNIISNNEKEITGDLINSSSDIENYTDIKNKYCDDIITKKIDSKLSIKDAYLLKYYNFLETDAKHVVLELETYLNFLPNDTDNIHIKNYINDLKQILKSDKDDMITRYNLSLDKKPINRMEIEVLRNKIKQQISQKFIKSLYKVEENISAKQEDIQYNGKSIQIYEPQDNFNMLVSVLDAYGGADGKYENYYNQWNTTEFADNQRICTTYIGNKNLSMVKHYNAIIMGFDNISSSSIVKMAPYDLVSKNNELVTTSYRNSRFMSPEQLIDITRRYNEIDIERTDLINGGKLQPSYLISFAESKEKIEEETKKAASQFDIPIILINREKIAEQEQQKILSKVEEFVETKNINLIGEVIEDFCTNKVSTRTTIKDRKDRSLKDLKDIEWQYFSNEKLKEILNIFIETAKSEEEFNSIFSKQILDELKKAMKKENAKTYLWKTEFGYFDMEGLFDEDFFEKEREPLDFYENNELHFDKEIERITGPDNNVKFESLNVQNKDKQVR